MEERTVVVFWSGGQLHSAGVQAQLHSRHYCRVHVAVRTERLQYELRSAVSA